MDIAVYDNAGKKGATMPLSDKVFGARLNADLLWQVATSQMSNKRQVLAHTKSRAEVRGGGKKPWRQKGTGRARHGSIRSPIWVGGGIAHGPTKDVNFKKTVSRTQGKAALAVVLSDRVRTGRMLVVDALDIASGKTKDAVAALATLAKGMDGYRDGARVLLVLGGTPADLPTRRATANLSWTQTVRAQDLNALTVLSFPYVIAVRDAVAAIEKGFSKK
jgi:large subunit ribosomal protein L4